MKLRAFLLIAVLLLGILFVAINWELFRAPNQLNLLVLTVQAPIGIIMLAVVAGLSLLYWLLLWRVKAAALLESRDSAKELEQACKAAMCAEESRMHHLQAQLESQFKGIDDKLTQILTQLKARDST